MAVKGHLIKEEISVDKFLEIVSQYGEDKIDCSSHAFFRLSEGKRKIFISAELVKTVLHEKPVLVGLQHNGNYAVFYKRDKDILRMVVSILPDRIEIITFYIIDKVPKI